MTETRRWLDSQSGKVRRRSLAGWVLLGVAGFLVLLALGVWLAHRGTFQAVPVLGLLVWVAALITAAAILFRGWRALAPWAPRSLAERLERLGAWRRGSVWAVAEPRARGASADLFATADQAVARKLEREGGALLVHVRRRGYARLGAGVAAVLAAAVLIWGLKPIEGRAALFWNPVALAKGSRSPVQLRASRDAVRAGESVELTIRAMGAARATLWTRAPGETWRSDIVPLDSMGRALVTTPPLRADLFARASVGARDSDTLRVVVELPVFLTNLQLTARFPSYIERPSEPIGVGADTLWLPAGTIIETVGELSTGRPAAVKWVRGDGAREHALAPDGRRFQGRFVPRATARWTLAVEMQDGRGLDDVTPSFVVSIVPDRPPEVTFALPAADTTMPVSLRQPLVIDIRDDYGLSAALLEVRRVSRLGISAEPTTEPLSLGPEPGDRAIATAELDLSRRELLPGDTIRIKARAQDNAPTPQWGESREIVLRLPSLRELREDVRQSARAMAESADSLVAAQAELAQRTEALAAERQREEEQQAREPRRAPADEGLEFQTAEEAAAVAEEQERGAERAEELRAEIDEMQRALEAAGINDPEWQKRLEEIAELLDRAMTPELEERLAELQEALEQLDEAAMREALERLAEEQEALQDALERSQELFERAAIEGELSTLAQDAEELKNAQEQWNESVEQSPDSAAAAAEEDLAQQADSLSQRLAELADDLQERASEQQQEQAQEASEQAAQAADQMRDAAESARQQQGQRARQQGQQASETLSNLPQQLQQQQDELAQEWQQEVVEALDRSLAETASLAKEQENLTERMRRGDVGADLREQQGAVEEGVQQLMKQLEEAGGKNALLSPELAGQLGLAQQRMQAAREQLERPSPDARQAGEQASQAMEALNALAYRLLRSREAVSGAQSGSGLAEAIEQLGEMARQQGNLNSQAGQMMQLMPQGSQQLAQRLQQLAAEQRAMAEQLERLSQEGAPSGTEELAEEAKELAQTLEAGRLDPEVLERQERLFRRLLDAGRTLEDDEIDPERERKSEVPEELRPFLPDPDGLRGTGDQFRYPGWEELRGLSPEERRLVLDYFRRLNDAARTR